MMKKLFLIWVLLVLTLVSSASATIVYKISSPDDFYETPSNVAVPWSITANSSVNTTIMTNLFVTNVSNEVQYLLNTTLACVNATTCTYSTTFSDLGFYRWYFRMSYDNWTTNTSTTPRWFEVRASENVTYFKWENESGFEAMNLNKDTGDLGIAGVLNATSGNVTSMGLADLFVDTIHAFHDIFIDIVDSIKAVNINTTGIINATEIRANDANITNLNVQNIESNADATGFNITAWWYFGSFNWTTTRDLVRNWLRFDGNVLDFNETHLNETITPLVAQQIKKGDEYGIYNDTDTYYLNWSSVNATIMALDNDTFNTSADIREWEVDSLWSLNFSIMQTDILAGFLMYGINTNGTWKTKPDADLLWSANQTNLIATECDAGNFTYGFFSNGSMKCRTESIDTDTHLSDSDILALGYNHTTDVQIWVQESYYTLDEVQAKFWNISNWESNNNWPQPCPVDTYVTAINDTITCTGVSDAYLLNTNDEGGSYNFTGNCSFGTSTAPTNITLFSPGGTEFSCGVSDAGGFACAQK